MELKEISLLKFIDEVPNLGKTDTTFFRSWFFTKNYFELYYSDVKFIDLSFGNIVSSDQWIYVPLTSFKDSLSFLGMPIRCFSKGFNPQQVNEWVTNHLENLKLKISIKNLITSEQNLFPEKDIVAEESFQWAVVDLRNEEEQIFKNISKGHKSSIKSGQKELRIELIDKINFSLETFIQYREFYNKVTGVQKSKEFWNSKKKILSQGEGFLLLGYLGDKLGATSYFLTGEKDVYYGFGVYDRELMKTGVSLTHWPLYYAILESKKRGFENFIIGYHEKSEENLKLNAIFDFKKRFTSEVIIEKIYKYSF